MVSSIQIIFKKTYLTLGQNGPDSNGNEEILHTSLSSKARALPPDVVQCHN